MRSPVLIVRFVLFSLLTYSDLLQLVFASWNIHASVSAGNSVPTAAVMAILNSCAVFICLALGIAELVYPKVKTSHITFECSWAVVLSLFHTGTSIGLTVNGPVTMCRANSNWDACVSSSLLIPTAWLSSVTLLVYFFALFITTVVHMQSEPDIWSKTMYTATWFPKDAMDTNEKAPVKRGFENDTWAVYLDKIESTAARKARHPAEDIEKASWAQNIETRRGIDPPFARRDDDSSSNTSSARGSLLPPLPLRVEVKGHQPGKSIGSRFIERFRESQIITRPGPKFPSFVDDHDKPIPLPRLSQWLRADALQGEAVSHIPRSP